MQMQKCKWSRSPGRACRLPVHAYVRSKKQSTPHRRRKQGGEGVVAP